MLQLQLRTPNDPTGICKGSADLDRDNNNHNKLLSDLFYPSPHFRLIVFLTPSSSLPLNRLKLLFSVNALNGKSGREEFA